MVHKLPLSAHLGALHNQFKNEVSVFHEGVKTDQLSLAEMKTHLVAIKSLYSSIERCFKPTEKKPSFWERVTLQEVEDQPPCPPELKKSYEREVLVPCQIDIRAMERAIAQKEERMVKSGIPLPHPFEQVRPSFRLPFFSHSEADEEDGGPPGLPNGPGTRSRSLLEVVPVGDALFPFLPYVDLCVGARTCKVWQQMWLRRGAALYQHSYTHIRVREEWKRMSYVDYPSFPELPLALKSGLPFFIHIYNRFLAKVDLYDGDDLNKRLLANIDLSELKTCRYRFHHYCDSMSKRYLKQQEFGNPTKSQSAAPIHPGKDCLTTVPESVLMDCLTPYLSLKELSQSVCISRRWERMCQSTASKMHSHLNPLVSHVNTVLQDYSKIAKLPLLELPDVPPPARPASLSHIRAIFRMIETEILKNYKRLQKSNQFEESQIPGLIAHMSHPLWTHSNRLLATLFAASIHQPNQFLRLGKPYMVSDRFRSSLLISHYPEVLLDEPMGTGFPPQAVFVKWGEAHHIAYVIKPIPSDEDLRVIFGACLHRPDHVLPILKVWQKANRELLWHQISTDSFRALIKFSPDRTWRLLRRSLEDQHHLLRILENRLLGEWVVQLVRSRCFTEAFDLLETMQRAAHMHGHWYNPPCPFERLSPNSPTLREAVMALLATDFERARKLPLLKAAPNSSLEVYLSQNPEAWQDLALIKDVAVIKEILDLADAGQLEKARQMVANPTFRNNLHDRLLDVVQERRACGKPWQAAMVRVLIEKAKELLLFRWHRPGCEESKDEG